MDEIDLSRAATAQIKASEGDYATAIFAAGHRAMELRGDGDTAGADIWDKIVVKIKELESIGYAPSPGRSMGIANFMAALLKNEYRGAALSLCAEATIAFSRVDCDLA